MWHGVSANAIAKQFVIILPSHDPQNVFLPFLTRSLFCPSFTILCLSAVCPRVASSPNDPRPSNGQHHHSRMTNSARAPTRGSPCVEGLLCCPWPDLRPFAPFHPHIDRRKPYHGQFLPISQMKQQQREGKVQSMLFLSRTAENAFAHCFKPHKSIAFLQPVWIGTLSD